MIPYGRQTIEDDDIQAVIEVLKSDFLTTGPKSTEFEEAVKSYTGSGCNIKWYISIACGLLCSRH